MFSENSSKKISSLQHPLVKHLVKLRQNRDYREEHRTTVIYGNKIVEEIGEKKLLKTLLVKEDFLSTKKIKAEQVFKVTEDVLKKISGVISCEDLVAEIELPMQKSFTGKKKVLCLEGISDPGNLGTLIRTAAAFNWEGVFLLPNSVDPFNDKAIRSSKGACFEVPLYQGTLEELKGLIAHNQLVTLIADLMGEPLQKIKPLPNPLLILGNESVGVSEEIKKIGKKITIPITDKTESLNVAIAGGILMYALSHE